VLGWLDAHAVSIVDGAAFGLLYFTLAVGLSLVLGAGAGWLAARRLAATPPLALFGR